MEMEENQAQLCEASGDTAPDAGEQEDFEALIRGRYKEEFDAKVRKILDGRLRGMRQENQQLKEQKEKLEGVRKAEAAERIDRLRRQEGELRRLYPDFDWQREMRSERFGRLILAGVEPRTAYETVHGRELMEKAMHYAAGRTRRQVAGSLASGMSRVAENGGRSIAVTASDPRGLTSEDLADIRRRVLDGEKIRRRLQGMLSEGSTDCHTSDIGHWFAMTEFLQGVRWRSGG